MNYLRALLGAGFALVTTIGLFYLMPLMIENAHRPLDEKPATRIADITMPKRDIETNVEEPKPAKPANPEKPPPDMAKPETDNTNVNPGAVNIAAPVTASIKIGMGTGIGASDGEYLPIVKVAPMYPSRARSRGIEGYCTVEYTVTKSGSVRNPVPIDCSPKGYFERASVRAALKFKYKPRVVDGQPIDVTGVRNLFKYTLQK